MKRLLEWIEWGDEESGLTETALLVIILVLIVGSCIIAGLKYVGD